MAICPNCLGEMPNGQTLCETCAANTAPQTTEDTTPVADTPAAPAAPQFHPQFTAPQPVAPAAPAFRVPLTKEQLPAAFKPLGAWAYFGYTVLFAIPLVGFVFLLVFALGGTRNIHLKNYARSYFCALLVGVILAGIAVALVMALGISLPLTWPWLN